MEGGCTFLMTLWTLRPVGSSVGTGGSFCAQNVDSSYAAARGGQLGRFVQAGGAASENLALTALQRSDSYCTDEKERTLQYRRLHLNQRWSHSLLDMATSGQMTLRSQIQHAGTGEVYVHRY